jgi:hypothetical protein
MTGIETTARFSESLIIIGHKNAYLAPDNRQKKALVAVTPTKAFL